MQPLAPDQLGDFLRRFHRGHEGKLRAVEVALARGSVAAVTFTLAVRDADHDDDDAELRLQVAEVNELRLQVRPTEDPQSLVDGVNIEVFQGLFFVDLLPWSERPSGVHDYRVSSCYTAGAVLRWEVVSPEGTV
jgi:hypothetical protein